MAPPDSMGAGTAWQAEADLLADARETLERLCRTTRYRHLYPEGPNIALLLEAYQELDRMRAIGKLEGRRRRRDLRVLRRLLKAIVRRDALDRTRRLHYHLPTPRIIPLLSPTPPVIERALLQIDPDLRAGLDAVLSGQVDADDAEESLALFRIDRALTEFRSALVNEALAHPGEIPNLHPQYLLFARAPLPVKKRHPIATLLLVKLPLYFWMTIIALFNTAYLGAYLFFNNERLGDFVGAKVSGLIDGDLELGSIHWRPRLIFDLVTGTPTPVTVRDVVIWDPYKIEGSERDTWAAYAPEIEVEVVLHEIIPWNRLGIPTVFEIPWVLHFTEAKADQMVWFDVREFAATNAEGETERKIGLRDAFRLVEDIPPPPGQRRLSFAVDHGEFAQIRLDLGFDELSSWRTGADLEHATVNLHFDAPPADDPLPEVLPFRFEVTSDVPHGEVIIQGIHVAVEEFTLERFANGTGPTPLGDIEFAGSGQGGDSPVTLSGALRGALVRHKNDQGELESTATGADLTLASPDAGWLVATVTEQLGLEPEAVQAFGAHANVRISGSFQRPVYSLAAQGLTIDALGEPAWAADDVDASVTLEQRPIPAPWNEADHERWVATIDTFSGSGFNGSFRLRKGSGPALAVLPIPGSGEPYRLRADLDLRKVDLAQLAPDDPEMAQRLQGVASGGIVVRQVVLAPPSAAAGETDDEASALRLAEIEFDRFKLTRDRGPAADGLPKNLSIDGVLAVQGDGALDARALTVATDGGRASATGGLSGDLTKLKPTELSVDLYDGVAFMRALGLEPYFERLDAKMTVRGPLMAASGQNGSLSVAGLGRGELGLSQITSARLWMDRGTLHVRSSDSSMFGGRGSVSIDVVVFERGRMLEDPRVRAAFDLHDVNLARIFGSGVGGSGSVEFFLDDGEERPVRLSDWQARGKIRADQLVVGGTVYRNAETDFHLNGEGVDIDRLVLPFHKPVSPFHADDVTMAVGTITAHGRVGFADDPTLDLEVEARRIPLAVAGRILGVEAPVRGQIGSGTKLRVRGSVARPAVEGTVALSALNVAGIHLGAGQLDFTSSDTPRDATFAAHREIRVKGDFGSRGERESKTDDVDWTIDGVMAIGNKPKDGPAPVAAQVDVAFERLALETLFAGPDREALRESAEGQLEGLSAAVLTCNPGAPMLSDCTGKGSDRETSTLAIDLEMERAWIRARDGERGRGDPCSSPTTLCSKNRLVASVDGTMVNVEQPWELGTTGKQPTKLELSGTFDLSQPPAAPEREAAPNCLSGAIAQASTAGRGRATVSGTVDLEALSAVLQSLGIERTRGRLDLQLALEGHLLDPRLSGSVTLPRGSPTVLIDVEDQPFPVEFSALELELDGGLLAARGDVRLRGQMLHFGANRKFPTFYALAGPCEGTFQVAGNGTISASLIRDTVGSPIVGASGALDVPKIVVAGQVGDSLTLDRLNGTVAVEKQSLKLELAKGISSIEATSGAVDFHLCGRHDSCANRASDGAIALYVGGRAAARASSPPARALRAKIDDRGHAALWGRAYLAPSLDRFERAGLRVALDEVPYRTYDTSGRPELELELSSKDLVIQGRQTLVVQGKVTVDRSRWVRDAQEGVEILRLADASEAPESPPPDVVRALQFDVDVQTAAPLRLDNNVASGVEADVILSVTGSYERPEFSGRIDVEPGGTVDIPFLSGTYEIQRGRVNINREVKDAEVDVLASRQEPIFVDGQPRQVQLLLTGSLSEITPTCYAEGEARGGQLETTRGCFDYLVLGAGDVEVSDADVRRSGGGGLQNARKPLQVVSNVAEIDVSKHVGEAVPRYRNFVPDMHLRLGQIGPELEIATPVQWFDFDYGRGTMGWDYTRGYPGFLLRNKREFTLRLELLDPFSVEYRQSTRSYLNERIIFDPLDMSTLELRFDFEIPSLR